MSDQTSVTAAILDLLAAHHGRINGGFSDALLKLEGWDAHTEIREQVEALLRDYDSHLTFEELIGNPEFESGCSGIAEEAQRKICLAVSEPPVTLHTIPPEHYGQG